MLFFFGGGGIGGHVYGLLARFCVLGNLNSDLWILATMFKFFFWGRGDREK